jgi:flagellin FlaA/flagellin FlaB
VTIENNRTGASVEIGTGPDQALRLVRADGSTVNTAAEIKLQRTTDSDVALRSAKLVEQATGASGLSDSVELGVTTGSNGESYIPLTGNANSDTIVIADGTELEVGPDTSSGEIGSSSNKIPVSAGETVSFEFTSNSEVRVTNEETGASVNVEAFNTNDADGEALEISGTVELVASDSTDIKSSGGTAFKSIESGDSPDLSNGILLVNDRYVQSGDTVESLNIVAIKGSGADQINMEETTITTIGPDGTNTLTYSGSGATEDETYTVEAIQDNDDSLPVMTDSDRFRVVIDPGTLETGETMTLEVTTESGATTEIRISVPNTLAGESAVQV